MVRSRNAFSPKCVFLCPYIKKQHQIYIVCRHIYFASCLFFYLISFIQLNMWFTHFVCSLFLLIYLFVCFFNYFYLFNYIYLNLFFQTYSFIYLFIFIFILFIHLYFFQHSCHCRFGHSFCCAGQVSKLLGLLQATLQGQEVGQTYRSSWLI